LFGCAALVVIYLTVELVTARHTIALTTTALAALFPSFVHISALVHNDSLATLMNAATFYAALSVAIRGPSRRRTIALAIAYGVSQLGVRSAQAVVIGLVVSNLLLFAGYVASLYGLKPGARELTLVEAISRQISGLPASWWR
jgi:dolichyl-phosphate-mannose--protein O-mannosyl transferase